MRAVPWRSAAAGTLLSFLALVAWAQNQGSLIGREVSIARHLQDGEEFELSTPKLIAFGEKLFRATDRCVTNVLRCIREVKRDATFGYSAGT